LRGQQRSEKEAGEGGKKGGRREEMTPQRTLLDKQDRGCLISEKKKKERRTFVCGMNYLSPRSFAKTGKREEIKKKGNGFHTPPLGQNFEIAEKWGRKIEEKGGLPGGM